MVTDKCVYLKWIGGDSAPPVVFGTGVEDLNGRKKPTLLNLSN